MSAPHGSTALPTARCSRCQHLAADWWRLGAAGDGQDQRRLELDVYQHLPEHPEVMPPSLPGCYPCTEAAAMSGMHLPGLAMEAEDGTPIDPGRLHRVHHLLQRTTR